MRYDSLSAHTRIFMIVVALAILPWAVLLILFPGRTDTYWMWTMADPRSAVFVGALYAGAGFNYLLALRRDDWPQTRMGLEASLSVSLVLMVAATVIHWDTIRPWHPMTLVWLPGYYAPLFLIPLLLRNERERVLSADQAEPRLSPRWSAWVIGRSVFYLVAAMALFVFAERLAEVWPWPIDAIEIRMFSIQPATFFWSAVAAWQGDRRVRRHRVPMTYVLVLGLVQLGGLVLVRTPYDWSSLLGLIVALLFGEWVVTALLFLRRYRRVSLPGRGSAGTASPAPSGLAPAAVTLGALLIGIAYLAFGLIGFLPIDALNPYHEEGVGGRYLLRFLAINPLHNVVHLLIGVTGIWAALRVERAHLWAKVMGVCLLALFAVGMADAAMQGFPVTHSLLGLVTLNSAGHLFHIATGAVAAVIGFSALRSRTSEEGGGMSVTGERAGAARKREGDAAEERGAERSAGGLTGV